MRQVLSAAGFALAFAAVAGLAMSWLAMSPGYLAGA